jgi:hypothetical protein
MLDDENVDSTSERNGTEKFREARAQPHSLQSSDLAEVLRHAFTFLAMTSVIFEVEYRYLPFSYVGTYEHTVLHTIKVIFLVDYKNKKRTKTVWQW